MFLMSTHSCKSIRNLGLKDFKEWNPFTTIMQKSTLPSDIIRWMLLIKAKAETVMAEYRIRK